MSLYKPLKTISSLLAFQLVFKFTRISKCHGVAVPEEAPWTFSFGPFGETGIVLIKSEQNVFRKTNVPLPIWVG